MAIAIKAEHISKEYRLGVINHGMLYKDIQSWLARRRGEADPHAKLGARAHVDSDERYWALKDLNFEIEQGDRVGLIGRNGAGKSTLLKILSRITAPTEGRIGIRGRVASLLEVGTGFHPELTGRENIYLNGAILGMKRREVARKFDEIVAFSEIEKFIDTPVKRYSSGMYVRLAFAVAANLDSEILLADEVLAVGDAAFQKKCLGKMEDVSRNEGRTVVFVSHNMGAVKTLCSTGILLDRGSLVRRSDIRDVVSRYFQDVSNSDVRFTDDSYLVAARIRQNGDSIVVEAEWREFKKINVPCLRVSFYDYMGAPIFIANSRDYDAKEESSELRGKKIHMVIKQPKLHDGDYYVTLHFGDTRGDFEFHNHCMRLNIQGMATVHAVPNCDRFGYIIPELASYSYAR